MSELPVLDPRRCIGCGDCVPVCPTQCLEMSGPLPWLPRPADCVACGLCALLCPVDALEVVSREW